MATCHITIKDESYVKLVALKAILKESFSETTNFVIDEGLRVVLPKKDEQAEAKDK